MKINYQKEIANNLVEQGFFSKEDNWYDETIIMLFCQDIINIMEEMLNANE